LLSSAVGELAFVFRQASDRILTPLLAAYAPFIFYVIIVSLQHLQMPDATVFFAIVRY